MHHPVLGPLHTTFVPGWKACVSLPAFQSCYERWNSDGKERRDMRDEHGRNGRFWVQIHPAICGAALAGGLEHGPNPLSDAQVAAIEYLLKNQERIAQELGAALVREAPRVYCWDYLEGILGDVMKRRLATPEGMLQVVELQGLLVYDEAKEECARVGFAFHSELLEPEHGVGVIMHRDRVLVVGTSDDLM